MRGLLYRTEAHRDDLCELHQRALREATATKSAAKTQANEMLVSFAASNREIAAANGCPNGLVPLEAARRETDALLLLPLRRAGQVKMWTMQGPLVL